MAISSSEVAFMKAKCQLLASIFHQNGNHIGIHTHKYHEIVYCVKGAGWTQINNKKHEFSSGDFYVTRAGTPHMECDQKETRIIYFYFEAHPDMVIEGLYNDGDGSILSTVRKLQYEFEECSVFKEDMIQSLLIQVLIETVRKSDGYSGKDKIRSALEYIDENLEYDIDFRALAKERHYSFDRFRHIFKEYTGYSPHQYVIRARIEKALFLLKLNPDISLTRLSYNCGFSSSSHFSKAFRSVIGQTPSEYLKKNR